MFVGFHSYQRSQHASDGVFAFYDVLFHFGVGFDEDGNVANVLWHLTAAFSYCSSKFRSMYPETTYETITSFMEFTNSLGTTRLNSSKWPHDREMACLTTGFELGIKSWCLFHWDETQIFQAGNYTILRSVIPKWHSTPSWRVGHPSSKQPRQKANNIKNRWCKSTHHHTLHTKAKPRSS